MTCTWDQIGKDRADVYLVDLKAQKFTLIFSRFNLIPSKTLQLELPNLLTLSLLAWGSATERELRLWNVLVGATIVTSAATMMANMMASGTNGTDDEKN